MREPESGPPRGGAPASASSRPNDDVEPLANLAAIVSVCRDWGIGCSGDMVVCNRVDMCRFAGVTRGRAVIMGRATLDSLPDGRPLAGRRNIVLTRDAAFERDGVEVVGSPAEALAAIAETDEAWLIGGAEIYRLLLRFCSRALVTRHDCTRRCDTFFPDLDADPAWVLECEGPRRIVGPGEGDEGLVYTFATYVRSRR